MKIDIIVTSSNQSEFDASFIEKNLSDAEIFVSDCCYETKSSDHDKVQNILSSLNNDSNIVLAMRGGAGATRLMDAIKNYDFNNHAKTIVGYSDVTVLLNYLSKYSNYQLIHGPMAFELKDVKVFNKFKAAINKEDVIFSKQAKWFNHQEISGEVIGGNLTLLSGMMGTFYEPDYKNKILLIEEIDEPLDKLDRMFAQLRDCGKLAEISGLLLGQFTKCVSEEELQSLFNQYFKDLNIGILYDINLGHVKYSDYIHLYTPLIIDESGIYYQ